MSEQVKHVRVARRLSRQIRGGELPKGSRLPGEHRLAETFSVSRGTVRQALAVLERDGLIAKHAGAGTFVVYDGEPLEERRGWSRALQTRGVRSTPEILRLERVPAPRHLVALGILDPEFLAVDRLRCLDDGTPISLECSLVPWQQAMAGPLADGLPGGSVRALLDQVGPAAETGEEQARLVPLAEATAAVLRRPVGALFLQVTRTTRAADGGLVEHVVSLLDPDHFALSLRYGDPT